MDELNQQINSAPPQSESVGFPSAVVTEKSGSPMKWIVFIVVILTLAGGIAFFFLRSSNETIIPEPTPEVAGTDTEFTPEPEPEPTPTPEAVNKEEINIQVLNGTGITGEANYLETQIKSLGYTKIDKGNAPSQTATTTTVTFASNVPGSVKTEISEKLKELYSKVETSSGSTGAGIDVKIITGLRKGTTPKPAATTASKTAAPNVTSSPKASGSPSSSPKPTATP